MKFLVKSVLIMFFLAHPVFAAQPLRVTETLFIAVAPDTLWEKIGDFCAISTWHPAVANCEIQSAEAGKFRILTLQDGGIIKERHSGNKPTGYMYSITEGPLPVKNYNARFELEKKDDGSLITWTASFLAEGATDEEAKDVITGIFKAGLESIKQ